MMNRMCLLIIVIFVEIINSPLEFNWTRLLVWDEEEDMLLMSSSVSNEL